MNYNILNHLHSQEVLHVMLFLNSDCFLSAVPCVPTNVSVVMDCTNNTALVSWSASLGAVQYAVTAPSNHNNVSCQTSDLTCNLDSLTCGSSYTVQVVAMDDNCSSIPSQALIFNTGNHHRKHFCSVHTKHI